MAANLVIPTSITDGQPLSAAPVKGNFDAVATWVNTNAVQLDGSKPMTGELVGTGADPTSANQYARKAYVDTIITGTGIIGTTQLAANAVTSAKILDDTILNADINSAAGIALTKLATGTAATVVMHNGSGVPTATAISGDITIGDTGVAAIGTGVIVNADINGSAAIYSTKFTPLGYQFAGASVSVANSTTTQFSYPTANNLVLTGGGSGGATLSQAGFYLISLRIGASGNMGAGFGASCFIQIPGHTFRATITSGTDEFVQTIAMQLAANDTVTASVTNGTGGTLVFSSAMEIRMICL
jgi:hypothetical protein